MPKHTGPLTKIWDDARDLIKEGKIDDAGELLDKGILHLASYTFRGISDEELLEGVKKGVWYERFWNSIEKHIWPTYSDYEENWKN